MTAQAQPGLRRRVARAAAWTAVAHAFTQVLRFGGNLLMTRLLVPEAFGLMAVVTTLLIGCSMLSDLGLKQSIVRSGRGSDPAFLDTVWSAQIIRGVLLFALMHVLGLCMHAAAGGMFPTGSVFRDPLLPGMIHAMAFNFLLGGFDSIKIATAQRGMAVNRVLALEVGCHAAGLLATILWGVAFRNVWALVAGAQVALLLRVFLGHVVLPGRCNRPGWERAAWREIIGYGKWIFLSSLLGFLAGNGDRLLLGVLFDSRTIGLTAIAMLILGAFQEGFAKLSTGVAFPALSETARERPGRIRQVYYRLRLPADVAFLFCAGLLHFGGASLIGLIYDHRYEESGAIFSILSLSLFAARFGVAQEAYLAMGRPDLLTRTTATRLVAMLAFVLPAGSAWGIEGAAWALVAAQVPSVALMLYLNARLGLLDVRLELRCLPMLALGAMAGVLLKWCLHGT